MQIIYGLQYHKVPVCVCECILFEYIKENSSQLEPIMEIMTYVCSELVGQMDEDKADKEKRNGFMFAFILDLLNNASELFSI